MHFKKLSHPLSISGESITHTAYIDEPFDYKCVARKLVPPARPTDAGFYTRVGQ